jgi:hypothetical protein
MNVMPVKVEDVQAVWPDVEPFLASALLFSNGEYNTDHAKVYVIQGTWQLVVFVENGEIKGAATIEYINRPNARIGFVTGIGGRLIAGLSEFEQLKTVLRANGATKLEGAAHPSVARLWRIRLRVDEKYRIVEAIL